MTTELNSSVRNMMKALFTDDILVYFTWKGKSRGEMEKAKFCDLEIHNVIKGEIYFSVT